MTHKLHALLPSFTLLLMLQLYASAAEFRANGSYPVGRQPVAVATGDFDGNGKLDIVVVNTGSNSISVLLGNGDGRFAKPVNYQTGLGPQSVAVGDVNRDGMLDLVVANAAANTVTIFFGNGDGTFHRAHNYPVGSSPRFVALADLRGDGKLDVVVANSRDNTVSILRGNGDGSFGPGPVYRVGDAPNAFALADFNRDGVLDLAVLDSGSNNVMLLKGNGDGTFRTGQTIAAGKSPLTIAAEDFDGDGKPDLVITNADSKNVHLLLGNGDGSFHRIGSYAVGSTALALAVGDFNAEEKMSLAVANPKEKAVGLLVGHGDGKFHLGASLDVGVASSAIAAGDFNGDGAPDLVVANQTTNAITVLLNSPRVQFSPAMVQFGVRPVGNRSPERVVTLTNGGSAPLNITHIDLTGSKSSDFTLSNDCPLSPLVLGARQSCTLRLTFAPKAKVSRKATLTVADNADGSPHSLTLNGGQPAPSTIWLGGAGNWSDSTKWSAGVPTSTTDALIDNGNAAASAVTLDMSGGSTNNFTLDNDDSLSFNNGTQLTVNGSSISNAGTISLNSVGNLTTLFAATGATLSGAGSVTMSNNSQNQVDGNGGVTLTNQNTIQGVGMIGPHFVFANQGTVNANVNSGTLNFGQGAGGTFTNSATLEATNGGILAINVAGITNTGGTIKAVGSNSQVQFAGGADNITGGKLTTSGGGTIFQNASTSSTLATLTNAGTFSLLNNATVNLSGTITNTGSFSLNSTGSLTELFVPTAATLTGTGTVTMGNNSQNGVDGNSGATLTNQSTIQGVGMIGPHFLFTNQGTVNANVNGATLALGAGDSGTFTNSATLEATNGGILAINLFGITNTGGTIQAVGTGSQVQFTGAGDNITGGTLTTSSGGTMTQTSASSTLTTLTNSGTFSLSNNTTVNLSGTITNTGTFQLNSAGNLTSLFVPTAATLTGTGTVTMSNNSQNQVDGNGGATLTNQSTIQGVGMIGPHFNFTNQGTVNANVNGAALILGPGSSATYTNTATMEATAGGILQLNLFGITNTGGTIKAVGTNSQVQLTGGGDNITGGILTTSNGGTIVQTGASSTLTNLTNSGTFSLNNNTSVNLSGTLTNNGTINVNSAGNLTFLFAPGNATLAGRGTVVLNNNPNSAIDGNGGFTFTNQSTIQGGGTIGPHVTFNNKGTLNVPASNTLNINAPFVNFATNTLTGGIYLVTGTLQFTSANIITNAAAITLTGTSSQIIDQFGNNALASFATNSSKGTFVLAGGRTFTTAGTFQNSGTLTVPSGSSLTIGGTTTRFSQSGGTTTVDGVLTAPSILISAGSVFGTNKLAGRVTSSGTITPGDSATQTSALSISRTYTQDSTGTLAIGIGGTTAGSQFGQLNVTQSATLGGTLNITLLNSFVPSIGQTFTILNASSVTGTFATVNGTCINSSEHFTVTYNPSNVVLTVSSGACM